MKGITFEATVRNGQIVLPEGACIPDNTRVYVVVSESQDPERVHMMSPRLVYREELPDFTMQMEREVEDGHL